MKTLLGFGDWMTLLRRLPVPWLLRLLTCGCGVLLTLWWFRRTALLLMPFLAGHPPEMRHAAVQRLVVSSWGTGGIVAVVAALFSPLGPA